MFNYDNYTILLACGATDMRRSINGLYQIIESDFQLNPFDSCIFVFCNRRRDRIKMLVWSDNGFWLHFKRIEKGHIVWPEVTDDETTMSLTVSEVNNLINSPGIQQKIERQEVLK